MVVNRARSNSGAIDFNIIVWNCGISTTQTGTSILVGLVFSFHHQFTIYVGFDGLTFYFEDYGVRVTPFVVLGLWTFGAGATGNFFGSPPLNMKTELVWEL